MESAGVFNRLNGYGRMGPPSEPGIPACSVAIRPGGWHVGDMVTRDTTGARHRAGYLPWLAGVGAGFLLAVAAGLLLVYLTGFDFVCKHQILCTVGEDKGWASQVHVTWEDEPSRSFTVAWRTATPRNPDVVEYRRSGEREWRQTPGTSVPLGRNGLLRQRGTIHRATVENLEPGTEYEYRVSHDSHRDTAMSTVFRTRTAPAPGSPVSFVFFADTGLRGRPDRLSEAVEPLQRHLRDSDVTFLLGGGDYAYANSDGRHVFPGDAIDEWFRQWQPVLARVPFMPQYGNHEIFLREGFAFWAPRFGHANGYGGGRAYSFDVGPAHFTAMFAPGDGYMPPDDLLRWLDTDLGSARENGAKWLIVYQHDSLFGHGLSHPADPRLRRVLMPILEKHGVDLHLAAQDQSYERTFPLRTGRQRIEIASHEPDTYVAGEGVIYLKVSPAGKKSEITRDFSLLPDAQAQEIAQRSDDGFHFAQVEVSQSRLSIDIYKLRPGEEEFSVFENVSIERRVPDR